MESTSCTSLACLLVYLAINAMLPAVWSAPISTKQPTSGQTKGDLEHVANVLYKEADKLCSEMCKIPNLCSSSIEHFLRADLELPEIKHSKSGCLSTNFNKEKCLPKIYSDLLRFQTYLEFLKEAMPSNKDILEFIQYRSTELANKVKDLEEIPSDSKEDTSGITVADLRSKDPWKQIQTSYIILQSFTEYMQKTARAAIASEPQHCNSETRNYFFQTNHWDESESSEVCRLTSMLYGDFSSAEQTGPVNCSSSNKLAPNSVSVGLSGYSTREL